MIDSACCFPLACVLPKREGLDVQGDRQLAGSCGTEEQMGTRLGPHLRAGCAGSRAWATETWQGKP